MILWIFPFILFPKPLYSIFTIKKTSIHPDLLMLEREQVDPGVSVVKSN
jgi:hypothetical protein